MALSFLLFFLFLEGFLVFSAKLTHKIAIFWLFDFFCLLILLFFLLNEMCFLPPSPLFWFCWSVHRLILLKISLLFEKMQHTFKNEMQHIAISFSRSPAIQKNEENL